MAASRAKTTSSWVLVGLLAAGFFVAALGKFTGSATPMFESWGYAPWFATLIGVLELAGAIGLLIPRLTRCAIVGLLVIMLGAAYTHVANADGAQVLSPFIFLGLLWTVWWLRREPQPAPGTLPDPVRERTSPACS